MNLKTIIAKVASWFKGEAQQVETRIVLDATVVKKVIDDAIERIEVIREETMSTPIAAAPTAQAAPVNQVNTAVQIALALKAIDATLSVDAVQAGTTAALAALYPSA
jgi:hypothetical protein